MINRILATIILTAGLLTSAIAHPGTGIVMDSKGNVYYTDLDHVWVISPDGERKIAVANIHTHELYIDAQDNLFGEHEWYEGEATDKWGNYVWCLKNDGELVKTIPDVEGFLTNTTLVRDSEGNSYWIDKLGNQELLMVEQSGKSTLFSAHRFNDIRWLSYSKHDNNIYVVDHLAVKQVSPSGKVTTISNNLKESNKAINKVDDRHYIYGTWTDDSGSVYVAVYGSGKVWKINPTRQMISIYSSPVGWSPCAGLLAPDGSLWLMEFSTLNKTRVSRISPDGKQKIFK